MLLRCCLLSGGFARLVFACLLIFTVLAFFHSLYGIDSVSKPQSVPAANFSLSDLLSRQMAANRKVLAEHGLSLPDSGATYERILIITTFRSGSTFTGELLSQIPGVMYTFEPLLFFSNHDRVKYDNSLVEKPLDLLYRMLQCDYGPLFREFRQIPTQKSQILRRNAAYRLCREVEDENYCGSAKYFSHACRYFPIQVVKTVRLPLEHILPLLRRPELNLRVILLVRDPRGSMASRRRASWCQHYCRNLTRLSEWLRDNYQPALKAAQEFPERFTVLRYEEIASDPEKVTEWLLKRLGIPVTPSIAEYIKTHTPVNTNISEPLIKRRGSRVAAWKEQLTWEEIQDIQSVCQDVLDMYGYVRVSDANALNETETYKADWQLPIEL